MRLTAAGTTLPTRTPRSPGQRPVRSRRGIAAIAGLGVIMLAAGCSTGGSSAGDPVSGTVTVAAVPGIDTAPLYLAQTRHMFSAAGLTVQIKDYPSVTAEVSALTTGRVDIAAGDYGPWLYADSHGGSPQIKIVSDGYDATAGVLEVLTLPDSKVTSPGQLVGTTIASPNDADLPTPAGDPDSLATAATTSVLRGYGIDMATVTWKPMAPSTEVAALRQHQVDAILVTEPYIYQAESQLGAVEVLDSCSGATAGLPLSGYFAMNAWSGHHKAALTDFRSALGKAQENASVPGPVQSILHSYTGMSSQDAAVVTVGSYPDTTNASDLQRVSQLMSDQGMLSTPVSVSQQIIH